MGTSNDRSGSQNHTSEQLSAMVQQYLFDPVRVRMLEQSNRALTIHLADFRATLLAKGGGLKHVEQACMQARTIVRLCRAKVWHQLTPAAIQVALHRLLATRKGNPKWDRITRSRTKRFQRPRRGKSLSTANHYLGSIKGFANWMLQDYRASQSPCLPIRPYNASNDPRHPRRPLTHEEFVRLIDAANKGPDVGGIPGYERAMGYLQAATTGLRSAELQSLGAENFDLTASATIRVEGAYTKNGHRAVLPLRPDIAEMLRTYIAQVGRSENLFRRPPGNAMRGLRQDLKAAGIPYKTSKGFADFHALRHTFITNLFDHGASAPDAQKMARHRTAAMTARYAHSSEENCRRVMDRFPAPPAIGTAPTAPGDPAQPK